MRIVNREEFLKMPQNTVFSKYIPYVFGQLFIKDESIGSDGFDFYYSQIADAIDCKSSTDFDDLLDKAKRDSTLSLRMDFEGLGRDGCFEDDQLFAVFEKEDVAKLINRLKECT